MIVTFDLFSAMTNSRAGGSQTFAKLARSRGWEYTGEVLYDRWDAHNKMGRRPATAPTSFHDLSLRALRQDTFISDSISPRPTRTWSLSKTRLASGPCGPTLLMRFAKSLSAPASDCSSNVDDRLARRTPSFSAPWSPS